MVLVYLLLVKFMIWIADISALFILCLVILFPTDHCQLAKLCLTDCIQREQTGNKLAVFVEHSNTHAPGTSAAAATAHRLSGTRSSILHLLHHSQLRDDVDGQAGKQAWQEWMSSAELMTLPHCLLLLLLICS